MMIDDDDNWFRFRIRLMMDDDYWPITMIVTDNGLEWLRMIENDLVWMMKTWEADVCSDTLDGSLNQVFPAKINEDLVLFLTVLILN